MTKINLYLFMLFISIISSTLTMAQTNSASTMTQTNQASQLNGSSIVGYKSDPMMMPYYTGKIIPTPKHATYKDEYISITNTAIILNDIAKDDIRLKYLLDRITRYNGKYEITEKPTEKHTCIIKINDESIDSPEQEQGYTIKSSDKTISIKGTDFQGLLWAISSLNQMIFIKNGEPVVRSLNVTDWPDSKFRGMLGQADTLGLEWYAYFMVTFKFNVIDFRGRLPNAKTRHILDKKSMDKFKPEQYYAALEKAKNIFAPLQFPWYAGCWETSIDAWKKKDGKLQINCGSEKDFNFFYNTIYEPIAKAGGNISMQFDDSRFPVNPDDIEKFGSAGKADYYWIVKVYNKVKKINPDIKILFCPAFYWGPESESPYPESREDYLKAMGNAPEAIDFYWSGPRVKGTKTTPSDVKWITNLIKRKPVVFQNAVGSPHIFYYHYGTDPVVSLKKWYYDGYFNDIKGYFLNSAIKGNSGVLVSIADWTWNQKAYNPEKVIVEAINKLMGPKAYPEMLKINKSLSFFDKYYSNPVNPNAMKHAKEITAAYKQLKKELIALEKVSLPKPYDYWMGLFSSIAMDFAGNAIPKALKDPNMNKYAKYSEIIRKTAEKEAGFSPKKDILRSALEFTGGKGPQFYSYKQKKKGIDVKKRLCTWIYGKNTINSSLKTKFDIMPFPPSGDYKLIISGLDDDSTNKCPIRIYLNGCTIFNGENPFSNKNWDIKEFNIPAEKLQRNNTLTIYNTAESDSTSSPPFFMLNYAILRDTTK